MTARKALGDLRRFLRGSIGPSESIEAVMKKNKLAGARTNSSSMVENDTVIRCACMVFFKARVITVGVHYYKKYGREIKDDDYVVVGSSPKDKRELDEFDLEGDHGEVEVKSVPSELDDSI
mmetsp:Transcript_9423/g.7858  ORF Transcript_9423/g.7858 Transcript_9423/m.7858 type:complete len:121 (-) Transcript_9423:30-392(-)